jgi:hypothetical protein
MARARLEHRHLAAAYRRDSRRLLVWFTRSVFDGQIGVDLVCGRIRKPRGPRVSPGPISCLPSLAVFTVPPRPAHRLRARVRRRHPRLVLPSPPVALGIPGAGCLAGG